jgi:hypothetical protein
MRRASIHLSGNNARADAFSRCAVPESSVIFHPLKNRGRRKSRVPVAPMSPVRRKHGVGLQVKPESHLPNVPMAFFMKV